MNKIYAIKEFLKGDEIKDFRHKNNLSTKELSSLIGVSYRTIEGWETNNKEISGPIVLLIKILNDNSELLKKYEINKKEYPLRLYYMCKDDISTIIDVDLINRKVLFKNYTNNVLLRAFGNKEEVTYEDFEEFVESRCFPKSRDKIKIELDKLDLPFYDPYQIIKITKGRMAEDDCHIEIEENND